MESAKTTAWAVPAVDPGRSPLLITEETKDAPIVYRDGSEQGVAVESSERAGSELINFSMELMSRTSQIMFDAIERGREAQRQTEEKSAKS